MIFRPLLFWGFVSDPPHRHFRSLHPIIPSFSVTNFSRKITATKTIKLGISFFAAISLALSSAALPDKFSALPAQEYSLGHRQRTYARNTCARRITTHNTDTAERDAVQSIGATISNGGYPRKVAGKRRRQLPN